eukprot:gene25277-biopygen19741
MSAKEDVCDQPGDPEILRNILRISPISKLTDKRIGACELRDLALKDSIKEHASRAIGELVAINPDNHSTSGTPAQSIVQQHAATTLGDLVVNYPANQGKAASAGAIPPLVALLSASTPAHVQEHASRALVDLVVNNPVNQGKVASAGAIPPLVALLSAGNPAHVQEHAATALGDLVLNHQANQGKAASAGAIPPLVALLPAGNPAHSYAVDSLMHIASCSTQTRKIMAEADAITPLVGLLANALTSAPVFSTASLIVTTLLSDPRVCVVFTSATPFLLLITLLQASGPVHVLGGTAIVLRHLARISTSIRRELAAAGIIPPLMAVRAASSTPPKVQEQLDMLHVALQDVCSCRDCVSKSKRMTAQTSRVGSSTFVLEVPVATTSVAEPVDSDKLMQELLEEEEREKDAMEAKATTKKEKKQRQKEKKKGKEKGKEKSKDEQVAADQVSEGGDKDAEKHLVQQQHAGEGGASNGSSGVEPSGSGTAVLAGDRECIFALSGPGDTRSSAPGCPPGIALNVAVAGTSETSAVDATPATTHVASADDATTPSAAAPSADATTPAAAATSAEAAPVVDVAAGTAVATEPSASAPSLTSTSSNNGSIGTPFCRSSCRAAQTSTSTPPAHIPSFRSPPAPVGAYQPLRRQPPYTSSAPFTNAATSPTVPPNTAAAPSIGPPNMNPVQRTTYPPPPLAAHRVRPVVAGHTTATQPATYPAHIQQLRHPALASAGPPLQPIPTALSSTLPRIPLQQGQGAVGGMAAGAHADADDDELLCVVCFERERNVFLQPCGHVIMCSRCCDEVEKSSTCPICRAQVLEHTILE